MTVSFFLFLLRHTILSIRKIEQQISKPRNHGNGCIDLQPVTSPVLGSLFPEPGALSSPCLTVSVLGMTFVSELNVERLTSESSALLPLPSPFPPSGSSGFLLPSPPSGSSGLLPPPPPGSSGFLSPPPLPGCHNKLLIVAGLHLHFTAGGNAPAVACRSDNRKSFLFII